MVKIGSSFKFSFFIKKVLFLFILLSITTIYSQDTDGDGIVNSIDRDDDNDGILDVDECNMIVLEDNPLLLDMIVKVGTPEYSPGQTNQNVGTRMVFEMVDPDDITTTVVVCRITILSITPALDGATAVIDWTVEDDSPRVNLKVTGGSSSSVDAAKVKFEFFDPVEDIANLLTGAAGVLPVDVSFSYGIKDIDLSPEPRTESIAIDASNLTGYTIEDPTTLTFSDTDIPGYLLFTGTINNPTDIIKLTYFDQQTFEADIRSTHSDSGFIFNFGNTDVLSSPIETVLQCTTDKDGDGIPNHLDIDADNDGIPDNVEAQSTLGYIPPSGVDTDNDGLDDAYDPDCTPCGLITGVPVPITNTDGVDNPDYIDTDADNDGILDINENGFPDIPLSEIDTDNDGLDDVFEGSDANDGFDVNDEIETPQTDLPDTDEDVLTEDVNYRDDTEDPLLPGVLGNILWLRADKDVTGTTNITAWNDQSGDDEHASGALGTRPNKIDTGINFNPSINFNGSGNFMQITGGILEDDEYNSVWVYSVMKSNATQNAYVFNENEDGADALYMSVYNNQDRIRFRHAGNTLTTSIGTFTNDVFSLQNYGANNNTTTPSGTARSIYENGQLIRTGSSTSTEGGDNQTLFIGSLDGASNYFNGEIAEIMVFNDVPSALKQQHIQSYLAIKYGITLDITDDNATITEGDYLLKDLTTKVWDYTENSAFHNDVAGIGRDDAMALNQKQSKSINSDAVITIGLAAIAENNETNINVFPLNEDFLVWGNNNGDLATTTSTTLLCAPELTINRTWKIVETGNIELVQIAIQRTILDAVLTTPSTVKVLKTADDAAFTTNVHYIPVIADVINGYSVYETKVNFFGTKYFTYAEVNGIFWNGDLNAWVGGSADDNSANTDADDVDKVMVIDSESSMTHAILNQNARIECIWIQGNSRLSVAADNFLEFDENFVLDGEIRLVGQSQIVQTHSGVSNVVGTGKIFRDQQSTVPNVYRYHYWGSPVVETGLPTYRVGQVLKDGSIPTSSDGLANEARDINFTSEGYDGAFDPSNVDPISIANYWIYSYLNGTTRGDWIQKKETGVLNRGQGFIMKSTGRTPQNFAFTGTPNDGTISISVDANTSSLLANPYPSALDAVDFINDNITTIENPDGDDAIDGTLYFWEHTGNGLGDGDDGHNKYKYQGAYSTRNLIMGIAAAIPIDGAGGLGDAIYNAPGRYIPVGQGFFVNTGASGGTIIFENSQRNFQIEDGVNSIFLKSKNKKDKELSILKLGLSYKNDEDLEIHKQVGISFIKEHTFGFENGYDSETYNEDETDFYWKFTETEKKLSIASVPTITNDLEVPLSIKINTNNKVYLMLDEKQSITHPIYLLDKIENKMYDFDQPIDLNLEKGEYLNRFFIVFSENVLNINALPLSNNIKVYNDIKNKELVILNKSLIEITKIDFFNLLGQQISRFKNIKTNDIEIRIPNKGFVSGVYFVKVKTTIGVFFKKIIIKK
ncbi:MAG: LamG-like jellyroll fold domain-containing protein [Polaribacter sp.]|uniref:LamG-like jellyroll fold domain-containing protein n=1 Tax=Polaribacter sp. TaxID=1920175 RepID=UPI002F35A8F7